MSIAEAAHRPADDRPGGQAVAGVLLIIAAGIGLAWIGAGAASGSRPPSAQFRTVKAGSGALSAARTPRLIEYTRTTDDGTVFDSSDGQGPQPFTMEQGLPGLRRGDDQDAGRRPLPLRMPPSLAYGHQRHAAGLRPNGSDL